MEGEQRDSSQDDPEESGGMPDTERAVHALSLAGEMLQSAESKSSESSYEEAIVLARDSMRLASSAVLFLDGKVASDLDTSCRYLSGKYGDVLNVDEWREVERMPGMELAQRLTSIFGGRDRLRKDAEKALESAARFLGATTAIVDQSTQAEEGNESEARPAPKERLFGEAS